MKAKRRLEFNGIESTVIKTDGSDKTQGCAYGLKIRYADYFGAVDILKSYSIPFEIQSNTQKR